MISPPKALNAFQYVWRSPWVRVAVFLLAFYLLYRLFGQIRTVVVVFALGYLIAYLANPLLNWLERGRVKRGLGIFFVLLLFIGVFALVAALLVTISTQLIALLQGLPTQVGHLNELLDNMFNWLGAHGIPGTENVRVRLTEAIQTSIQNLGRNIVPLLQNLLSSSGTLVSGIVSVGGIVAQVVLILLVSIYLMYDYSRVNLTLLHAFPRPWQPRVLEFSELVGTSVGGYVRGQLLVALFVGVVVWLGLTVLGIPSAAAIGFLAGAFNIVPYLGPVIGAAPAVLLALPFGWLKILLVIAVFVFANQIEGHVLSPFILARTTHLHPVAVIAAILVGAALMGFVGALLAVPAMALGKLLLEKYYFPSRVYTEGP